MATVLLSIRSDDESLGGRPIRHSRTTSKMEPIESFGPSEQNLVQPFDKRIRARRILEQKIEYMGSPSFQRPDADNVILIPPADVVGRVQNSGVGAAAVKPPPGTPPYLAALYSYPLLSAKQEYHLFRKMNYLKYRAAVLRRNLNANRPRNSLLEKIEALLSDALELRNELVRANLRLVVSIAKRLVDGANSFDDLVSDGNVPLIRAVEIFDFERGIRFSTYATWAVRNTLYRSTPRNHRLRKRFLNGADAVFESVAEPRSSSKSSEDHHRELQRTIVRMLSGLDSRDRSIVVSRFGLDETGRPHKFREIAEGLNISTERVRQLLARSLNRLRDGLAEG